MFQSRARSLESLNALRRIDTGFEMVASFKGPSCLSVCLCLTPSTSLSPLEILNLLLAPFVCGGHGRAASLGTVAASKGPGARNQRNSN